MHEAALPPEPERSITLIQVEAMALVLGSTQPADSVDVDACRRHGIEVVRRRSGGGAVLVGPGEVLWVDVVLPRSDALWTDDVSHSSRWLGEAWSAALGDVGVAGGTTHAGALVCRRWSGAVCFAGLAPGEVTVGARKAVGIAQRRSRGGARFQCAVPRAWRPTLMTELLGLDDRATADLTDIVHVVPPAAASALFDALVARLPG
ncbi:MAG: hypothetical protein AVDCRST_MAG50-2319 [uncultured Acidimicrobiales bacterium]|uniref:BPL/LPL catalytic domain-containing protein n=1 Tax=uncultured Acidimicrobiales bacterium TaxID=310071 RepID=A0A6J4IK47_9ACTN|nr:MAG: hypothetical protein AVDCRST_MAG50-2319 [uncultured Acidimicrobiales bacterium]